MIQNLLYKHQSNNQKYKQTKLKFQGKVKQMKFKLK